MNENKFFLITNKHIKYCFKVIKKGRSFNNITGRRGKEKKKINILNEILKKKKRKKSSCSSKNNKKHIYL